MSLNKAQKAIFRAKYGGRLLSLLIQAENVIVTEDGAEKSLADVLVSITSSALTQTDVDNRIKALVGELPAGSDAANIVAHFTTEISGVSSKVDTLIGSDTGKSVRVIAGEVLAAAGKLTRKKVSKVDDIDPSSEDADEYIYMVPKAGAKSGDKYDEYMVIDGAVEMVGDWEVDLAGYLTKVTGATAGHFPALKADGTIEDSGKSADDFVEKVQGKSLSTNDYDATEKQKVSEAYTAKHTHANSSVLDGITAENVSAWNSKGKVHISATQPESLEDGDIWLQIFEE